MSAVTNLTANEFYRMPDDGFRYELVEGELRKMSPAGWKHGAHVGRLQTWRGHHIEQHRLGRVFGAETGFVIGRNPDTVRAPDIAFIQKEHIPSSDPTEAFWPGPPDLAVEVLSPDDRKREVNEKVRAWLVAGALAVWVVDPIRRNVAVLHSPDDVTTLTEADELDGEVVVPGIRCCVAEILEIK